MDDVIDRTAKWLLCVFLVCLGVLCIVCTVVSSIALVSWLCS